MLPHYQRLLRDADDVTLFLHGACHVFALSLHERFAYPLIVLRDLTATDQKNATHVYCRFSESELVDVVGIACEKTSLAAQGWSGPRYGALGVSVDKMGYLYATNNRRGLYVDSEFLEICTNRALARIARFADYYNGRIRASIPGASRTACTSPEEMQQLFNS